MSRKFTILLITVLLCAAVTANAGDKWMLLGGQFDSRTEHTTLKFGIAVPIVERAGFFAVSQTEIGRYGTESIEVNFLKSFRLGSGSDFALDGILTAATGFDWTAPGELDELTLVTQSGGVGIHAIFSNGGWSDVRYGFAAVIGYKDGINNQYDGGWQLWMGLTRTL
jgi:hypothetical protein